jgi:hypothetical protein
MSLGPTPKRRMAIKEDAPQSTKNMLAESASKVAESFEQG